MEFPLLPSLLFYPILIEKPGRPIYGLSPGRGAYLGVIPHCSLDQGPSLGLPLSSCHLLSPVAFLGIESEVVLFLELVLRLSSHSRCVERGAFGLIP